MSKPPQLRTIGRVQAALAIRIINSMSAGNPLDEHLASFHPRSLVEMAISDVGVFNRVLDFAVSRTEGPMPISAVGSFRLPEDILNYLLYFFDLRSRIWFAGTCREHSAVIRELTRHGLTRVLAPFDIDLKALRLLQAGARVLLSGEAIPRAIHFQTPSTTFPLDIYTAPGVGQLTVEFICRIGRYSADANPNAARRNKVWNLTRGGMVIRVVECGSDPVDVIMGRVRVSTWDMGWSDGSDLVHCYGELTADHVALLTPRTFPIPSSLADHIHAWSIVRTIATAGYNILVNYYHNHECSKEPSCQASNRNTSDTGVLRLSLPPLAHKRPHDIERVFRWHLGGDICGVMAGVRWLAAVYSFRDMEVAPTEGAKTPVNSLALASASKEFFLFLQSDAKAVNGPLGDTLLFDDEAIEEDSDDEGTSSESDSATESEGEEDNCSSLSTGENVGGGEEESGDDSDTGSLSGFIVKDNSDGDELDLPVKKQRINLAVVALTGLIAAREARKQRRSIKEVFVPDPDAKTGAGVLMFKYDCGIQRSAYSLCYQFLPLTRRFRNGTLQFAIGPRRVVAVPWKQSVTRVESISDIVITAWLPPHFASARVANFPGSSVPLDFQYTIVFVPRDRQDDDRPNTCKALRTGKPWHDNILVFKHGKRKAIIGMTSEDAFMVDGILNDMCLIFPCTQPVDPGYLTAAITSKYDALIHTDACGREESRKGLGEFRATIVGAVAEDIDRLSDDYCPNFSHRMVLTCPDWSNQGWATDHFASLYGRQIVELEKLASGQVGMGPGPRLQWTIDGKIVVHLTGETVICVPLQEGILQPSGTPALPTTSTVLVDATFHCGWDHRAQELRYPPPCVLSSVDATIFPAHPTGRVAELLARRGICWFGNILVLQGEKKGTKYRHLLGADEDAAHEAVKAIACCVRFLAGERK
ncbi:hypothetical protein C8R43DRAFT_948513 [Mycena crocata]|nr:hypothetical protein C8R43DRAFT_948513 [Mycena crocata]